MRWRLVEFFFVLCTYYHAVLPQREGMDGWMDGWMAVDQRLDFEGSDDGGGSR